MEQLKEAIRTKTTDIILECIIQIGGAFDVTKEQRIVRAALLSVYEERTSGDEVDALMDMIGLGA